MTNDDVKTIIDPTDAGIAVLAGVIADPALLAHAVNSGINPRQMPTREDGALLAFAIELYEAGDPVNVETVSLLAGTAGSVSHARLETVEKAVRHWPGSKVLFERNLDAILLHASRKALTTRLGASLAQINDAGTLQEIREIVDELDGNARAAVVGTGPNAVTADKIASKVRARVSGPSRHIPTGIRKLDHVLGGGIDPGRMYSLIGRFKIGKTTLMATLGYNIAYGANGNAPRKVVMISLERDELDVERLNAARALGINERELSKRFSKYEEAFEAYQADPLRKNLLYHHSPGANLDEVCQVVLNAHRTHGISVAFIDYYQVIFGNKSARIVDHLASVDRTLSRLAANLGIAIVIAAQADGEGAPRDCKTLLHSAAANFSIRRPIDQPDAWLENLASNYIEQRDAGSPQDPAIRLVTSAGPHFQGI